MLHWVETGKIHYMVIDKNIAKASGLTMKNLTPSLSLKENISISWATHPDAVLLTQEIDTWLKQIRKSGKLNYLYHRYFNNHQSVSHQTSKYALLKKGIISPYDSLLKKESKRLNWDWRLLAALVFQNPSSIRKQNRKSELTDSCKSYPKQQSNTTYPTISVRTVMFTLE